MKKNASIHSSRFVKSYLILVLLVFNVSIIFAQSMVSGVVTDANDGTPLPSANVYIDGTTQGTVTNLNGEFRLPLSEGSYTIAVSFVGYETHKEDVTIVSGQTTTLNFQLSPEAIMGAEVIVTAMQRGQRSAISSQLNAGGIINAVSEEQIQELPDANAGESIGRLPGISLKRSGGEAQKIVLRGLNEKFSSIQLDGVNIPATDAGARGVDLSLFSINSLAGIEVSKALTSDMDADAIAGTVNLITKKASETPEFRIDLGGGYNQLEKSAEQYRLGFRTSRRFFDKLLGLQASFNNESLIRSSERYAQGWTVRPDSTYEIGSLNLNYTKERRTRIGGSLLFDVNLKGGGAIRFNNFYSRTERKRLVYERDYPASLTVTYSITDANPNIQTINNSLSGEHFLGKIKANWGASHALSLGELPYQTEFNFVEGGSVGAGMDNIPNELLKGPGELLIPYAFNNFRMAYLNTSFFQTSENRDRDLTAHLDLERAVILSDNINITFKAGGKYRQKERTNDVERFRAPYWVALPKNYSKLEDGSIVPADYSGTSFADLALVGGANISMVNFLKENPQSRQLYDGKYDLNPFIDKDLAREWYDTHKNGISADGSLEEYNPYSTEIQQIYDITERITSGYAMATIDLGRMFRVIGGVRIEKEDNDYTSKFAPDIADFFSFDANQVGDTSATYTSTHILPNVHLRFKPVDWWDLRLAATKTLARPDFSMRLPTVVVKRTQGSVIDRGRPDLKNTEAWNYDVISSFYTSKYGLLTIGGFYKKLDNIFYMLNGVKILNKDMQASLNLPEGHGSYVGLNLNEPINTNGTEVYGTEVDLQANLKFLPGFLGNFVLRGNYSYIKSVTYIPRYRIDQDKTVFPPKQTPVFYDSEDRLEGQPSNFGNVAIGYDKGGFSGRLSVFFQGDYLTSVSATGLNDTYQKGYSKWDLALKQEILKGLMEIMLNVTNLTNIQEGTYWNYKGLDNGSTQYGMLVDLGIRINL